MLAATLHGLVTLAGLVLAAHAIGRSPRKGFTILCIIGATLFCGLVGAEIAHIAQALGSALAGGTLVAVAMQFGLIAVSIETIPQASRSLMGCTSFQDDNSQQFGEARC
jgi:hypothetical protein